MARKPMYDGGTKNKMIEVATKQFFEKGFEGTSIRSIVDEVECEVGLFYYYYKTKDELFTDVIENFFKNYVDEADKVIDEISKNTDKALFKFFMYVQKSVEEFNNNYSKNLHKSILWAIRERTLTLIEPYVEKIVNILVAKGANPLMDPHTTAIFLSHGVGSLLIHEESDWVLKNFDELRRTVNILMGLSAEEARKMFEK